MPDNLLGIGDSGMNKINKILPQKELIFQRRRKSIRK